jgi:hypothetical protein
VRDGRQLISAQARWSGNDAAFTPGPPGQAPEPSGRQRGSSQPPPAADNSLGAAVKLRRRRRMRAAAEDAALIAIVFAVAIPVVTGALGSTTARRTGTTQAETVYVVHNAGRS